MSIASATHRLLQLLARSDAFPVTHLFTGWFAALYFRFGTRGLKNVPREGPFVLACNHASNLDPYFCGMGCRTREVGFMAKEELFRIPVFSWFIRISGAFPIRRGTYDDDAFAVFFQRLREGRPVTVYPEGTRTRDGGLQRGKRGIGMLLYKARVPVLPAYLQGTRESLPKGRLLPRPRRVTLHIGTPVPIADLLDGPDERATHQAISDRVMDGIAALKASAECVPVGTTGTD
jgi:1-acyl-sn-glycerol-3-phosphate acyltransferase